MAKFDERLRCWSVLRKMAESGNWIMARVPGCCPFVITKKEWEALPLPPASTNVLSQEEK